MKIYIDGTEVLCDKNITITEEMLATSSVILNNVFPKAWDDDKDYTSRFYFPKDYSKCLIYNLNDELIFAGVVKNTGNISLNPREPHYASVQVLDFKTFLSEGTTLDFDYYKRGCAITCVKFLKEALGQKRIQYDPSLYAYSPTARELGRKYTENARWVLFYWGFIAGEDVSVPLRGDKQLLMPEDLVQAWQKATVNGEPLITGEPNVLVEGKSQQADGWFTPLMALLLLLVLAIANLFWKQPYWDWVMLAMQTVLGVILIYLMYFSNLCCTSWNWLLIPFNPLPAILWHWRKYWALSYTGILLIWIFVMIGLALWGHILVDWSHILLVVAWMLIVLKQSKIIKQCDCCRK